jgi:YD repeat-containing protein
MGGRSTSFHFEDVQDGGRLKFIENENGNTIRLEYADSAIHVTDPFGRLMRIKLEDHRVVELSDHAGRVWAYKYDDAECLTEVVQPATDGFPGGRGFATPTTGITD